MSRPRTRRWPGLLLAILVLVLTGPWLFVRLVPDPDDHSQPSPIDPSTAHARIYVADWGYHTSIILPNTLGGTLGPVSDSAAAYVEFAWGDRSFYMESNYWPHRLFATAFLPTPSVTYVAGWSHAPRPTEGMRALWSREVSGEELAQLYAAVEGSIRHDTAGARLPAYSPVAGYYGRFYPAHGYYLFWSDCNRWTLDRLHQAGLARSGAGVIVTRQVPSNLVGFHREGA